MAKIEFLWDNCIKCGTKLKTVKEKRQSYCKKCKLKQTLLQLKG